MTWQLGSRPGIVDAVDAYGRPLVVPLPITGSQPLVPYQTPTAAGYPCDTCSGDCPCGYPDDFSSTPIEREVRAVAAGFPIALGLFCGFLFGALFAIYAVARWGMPW